MKLSALLERLKIKEIPEIEITGISNNSERVRPGYVFVCIEGTHTDGHDHIDAALEKGAAVVVAKHDVGIDNQILVPDTKEAYAVMCAAFFGYPAEAMKLIGVTGTNGKTTVTNLIKSILEQNGYKVGLTGTICNMVGNKSMEAFNTTPDAFELHCIMRKMKEAGCQYVVMEVSSHGLDQKRVFGLHFAAAVFTNLTQDHLDYHRTMGKYLKAKKKLFFMCDKAIINYDDPVFPEIKKGLSCEVTTYSLMSDEADYTARNVQYRQEGVNFEMLGLGVISRVHFKTPGKFSVYNALAAGVCALKLGLPFAGVVDALSSAGTVKGRMEMVPTGRDFSVIIDYAHTPDGIKNLLETVNAFKKGRSVILFGAGGNRDAKKRPVMGKIAAELADYIIVTSDNMREENPMDIINDIVKGMEGYHTPYIVLEDREEAIHYAVQNAQTDDVIMIAGKGHETYQLTGSGTIYLNEREIVTSALAALPV